MSLLVAANLLSKWKERGDLQRLRFRMKLRKVVAEKVVGIQFDQVDRQGEGVRLE